ncbi:hypothetical protein BY996DRAFT_6560842 [Phakopsora pachyrhizi]|uniref:Uncharacterized protein n=1 Tax=Phakopsora pachyrhizi TaxID=170000 RepID=A0AAV0B4I3_PHAPC|nr:hypothetical protein BY996DRAFT_6560842 [Phakopsora pachyrhizi]CAH7677583.1 hypothetical protein PPACK8108_LOCUS12753 [Phakopsora pachyrhizi]
MTTVKTIINSYQKQNQLKSQNHNHKLSPFNSSSSTSPSNSNNASKKSNSNINIINQIYPASLLIEIKDQRICHLETKICSINSDLQNFAARLNSSSASSLLTSSNPTSPSIFKSQLASSNPSYGRHLGEQSINHLVIPDNQSIPRTFFPINTIHLIAYIICYYYAEELIIKTSTISSPTSTSSAMTTPHETSYVSYQTTSTPTLKDSSGQPPNHQQLHQTYQMMMISLTHTSLTGVVEDLVNKDDRKC